MKPGEIGPPSPTGGSTRRRSRTAGAGVVVFEDDVIPLAADLGELPRALSQLPDDFDMCYLGYMGRERPSPWQRAKQAFYFVLGPLGVVPWSSAEALRLHARPFSPNLRRAGLHMCAHAYVVSLSGARKLLEAQTPVAFRADWVFPFLILRGRLSAFVTSPRLFDQETPEHVPPGGTTSYIHG